MKKLKRKPIPQNQDKAPNLKDTFHSIAKRRFTLDKLLDNNKQRTDAVE